MKMCSKEGYRVDSRLNKVAPLTIFSLSILLVGCGDFRPVETALRGETSVYASFYNKAFLSLTPTMDEYGESICTLYLFLAYDAAAEGYRMKSAHIQENIQDSSHTSYRGQVYEGDAADVQLVNTITNKVIATYTFGTDNRGCFVSANGSGDVMMALDKKDYDKEEKKENR